MWTEALRGKRAARGRFSARAGRNARERRAGLEKPNAEADPPTFRGRLPATGDATEDCGERHQAGRLRRGSGDSLCAKGSGCNPGSPVGGAHASTGNPRGPAWAGRVAERLGVPGKPGHAGGGKEPQVERNVKKGGVGIQIVSCDLAHIVPDTGRVRFSRTFVGEPGSPASLRHLAHCLGCTSGSDVDAGLARIISFRQQPPSGPV